jgi:hypothetical protein
MGTSNREVKPLPTCECAVKGHCWMAWGHGHAAYILRAQHRRRGRDRLRWNRGPRDRQVMRQSRGWHKPCNRGCTRQSRGCTRVKTVLGMAQSRERGMMPHSDSQSGGATQRVMRKWPPHCLYCAICRSRCSCFVVSQLHARRQMEASQWMTAPSGWVTKCEWVAAGNWLAQLTTWPGVREGGCYDMFPVAEPLLLSHSLYLAYSCVVTP